jgi:hypothetical protein
MGDNRANGEKGSPILGSLKRNLNLNHSPPQTLQFKKSNNNFGFGP